MFLQRSGYTPNDMMNAGAQTVIGGVAILVIGSNGLTLDPQGRFVDRRDDGSCRRAIAKIDGAISTRRRAGAEGELRPGTEVRILSDQGRGSSFWAATKTIQAMGRMASRFRRTKSISM